jgi:hypothetical protein
MKEFTADELAAYQSRATISRDLIFIQCKDRSTGALHDFGFWNGTGDIALDVLDGITAVIQTRDFIGRGAVLQVGDVSRVDSLDVMSLDIVLSQLESDVENAARAYDMRNAPIQVYRALFSTANPRAQVAPARCRFAGFINTAPLVTPPEGGKASLSLNCVGCTRELTRTNTDLRSDESQQRRSPGDDFFKYVAVTGQVQVFWGEDKAT